MVNKKIISLSEVKKFSEKADAAILERLFKKDGGLISMEEMIKRPIYERY